jgi:hypothetical protein
VRLDWSVFLGPRKCRRVTITLLALLPFLRSFLLVALTVLGCTGRRIAELCKECKQSSLVRMPARREGKRERRKCGRVERQPWGMHRQRVGGGNLCLVCAEQRDVGGFRRLVKNLPGRERDMCVG